MSEPEILPPTSERPVRGARPVPQQTRGRPADPDVEVEPIDFLDDEGKPLTRRSRNDSQQNPYDIPVDMRRHGWDYEWKNDRVMNQPIDSVEHVAVADAGWRPQKATGDWLKLCPAGWDKPYIERGGMTLYTRPMHLTEEARQEDYAHAQAIKASRLEASAIGAQISKDPRMPAGVTKQGMRIEGEVGHHRQAGRDERRAK